MIFRSLAVVSLNQKTWMFVVVPAVACLAAGIRQRVRRGLVAETREPLPPLMYSKGLELLVNYWKIMVPLVLEP